MKFDIDACTNLTRKALKLAVEDYTDVCETGTMQGLDTMMFFQSTHFKNLCAVAEVSPDKVLEYVNAIELADTPRAKILNWIFDKKHFNEDKARIVFTSPEKINKTIERLSNYADEGSDEFSKGIHFAMEKFCEDVFENKFIQKMFYIHNIKTRKNAYKQSILYACNMIFNLNGIQNVTEEHKEIVYKAIKDKTLINDQWRVYYKYFMSPATKEKAVQENDETELDEKED